MTDIRFAKIDYTDCLLMSFPSMEKFAFITFLLLLFVIGSESSHFRGGTASWKHLSSNGDVHEIEFNFRFGWRRDYFSSVSVCDASSILSELVDYDGGVWQLSYPASSPDFPQSVAMICTTFEPVENWAYGYNSFQASVTSSTKFSMTFSGSYWIHGMYFGGGTSWSIAVIDIDVGTRSDTGKTNNPPSTLTAPVVRLQLGCSSQIVIPVIDEDGDGVTCRYANTSTECGGICGEYPHFTLIQETCIIEYDGGGGEYLVPVALMIEDHASQNIIVGGNTKTANESLSSIPLQFLVDIKATTACNVKPSFPPDTIPNKATRSVPNNGPFNETVQVYPSRPGIPIIYFVVIGPVGLHTSGVIDYGGDLYGTILSWIPTTGQEGTFTVCFYAVDDDGIHSEQRCFSIVVGDAHPCDSVSNGGCSDVCVKNGSSYTCSCHQPCWNLHEDGLTCIPTSFVTCGGGFFYAEFPSCVSDRTISAGTNFNGNPVCQSFQNSAYHYLHFETDQCGGTVQSSAAGIQYKTSLYIYKGVYFGIITRGEWVEITLTCTLPATANLTGSFLPEIPVSGDNEIYIEGLGTFTFYFDFYRDASFSSVYGPFDQPIEVTVKDDLYFILGAFGSGDLEFFTENCVATSDRNSTSTTLSYSFIENGCHVDPTLRVYTPFSTMENRFSIQAFQFVDKILVTPADAEVFIECSVRICVRNTPTICSRGCVSSVSKRSVNPAQDTTVFRFKKSLVDKIDDDYDVPEMERNESPLEDVTNSVTLLMEKDNIVDDAAKEEGNDAIHPVITMWMALFSVTISIFTH